MSKLNKIKQIKTCMRKSLFGLCLTILALFVVPLSDAQEFEKLSFDADRFDPDLLEELLTEASRTVRLVGDQVVISHLYTERQVYPLNLYLREMSTDKAEAAALDWGSAIKDLAAANIWPGDLFTKNFGVTRHGSVVFYDYDEICLIEDCRFRAVSYTHLTLPTILLV